MNLQDLIYSIQVMANLYAILTISLQYNCLQLLNMSKHQHLQTTTTPLLAQ